MLDKVQRIVAALEVEAGMMESHAKELGLAAFRVADAKQREQLLQLSSDEAKSAEEIRKQVRVLRDGF